jgi:hypothetical protein
MWIYLLVLPYAFVVLCGLFSVFYEYRIPRFRNAWAGKLFSKMSKSFDVLNINLAVFTVLLLTIIYFVNQSNIIPLIITCCFVLVSFIIENIKNSINRNAPVTAPAASYENHKNSALYAYIDIFAESISKVSKNILSMLEEQENTSIQSELAIQRITTDLSERIDRFLSLQKHECESLIENKLKYESVFSILNKTASHYNENYEKLMEKIRYSTNAIICLENSETLLDELRLSFREAYSQSNTDIINSINGLVDRINVLTLHAGSMQSFPISYKEAVVLCSVKMENILNALNESIKEKRSLITNICGLVSENILEKNRDTDSVQEKITDDILKNNFVFTKIMEIYAGFNLQKLLSGTRASYDNLRKTIIGITSYDDLRRKIIDITSIKVGNWSDGWIQQPGEALSARDVKYLRPVITYNSSINATLTLSVKIFEPIINSEVSPAGFTYSDDVTILAGRFNKTTDLPGWGSEHGGYYHSGTWRFEVWWENNLLSKLNISLK